MAAKVHPRGEPTSDAIAVRQMSKMLSKKEEQVALQGLDVDGDGKISSAELKTFLKEHRAQAASLALSRKVVAVLSAVLLLCLGINAAMTFMIVELTKDTKVENNKAVGGIVTDIDGNAAKTGKPLLELDEHIKYVHRNESESSVLGRRLLMTSEVDGLTELTKYYAHQKGEYLDKLITVKKDYIVAACTSLKILGDSSTLVTLNKDLGTLEFTSLDCESLQATGSLKGSRFNGKAGIVHCPAEASGSCDVYQVLDAEGAAVRRRLLGHASDGLPCMEECCCANPPCNECPCDVPCPCFPGSSVVDVRGRGAVALEHLRLDDEVLALGPSGEPDYFPIYLFAHRDVHSSLEYVNIETAAGARLRISPEHLLPIDKQRGVDTLPSVPDKGLWMPANAVAADDTVWVIAPGEDHATPSRVTRVTRSVERGVYNFHASPNFHVIVDGVVASEFGSRALHTPFNEWALQLASTARRAMPCRAYAATARAVMRGYVRASTVSPFVDAALAEGLRQWLQHDLALPCASEGGSEAQA